MATFNAKLCFLLLVLASVNRLDGTLNVTCTFRQINSSIDSLLATITCDLSRNLHQHETAVWFDPECTVLLCCWSNDACLTLDDRIVKASIITVPSITIQIYTTDFDISVNRNFTFIVYDLLDSSSRLLGASVNNSVQFGNVGCSLPLLMKSPCFEHAQTTKMTPTLIAADVKRRDCDENVDGCGVTGNGENNNQSFTGTALFSAMSSSDSPNISLNSSGVVKSSTKDYSPYVLKSDKAFVLICIGVAGGLVVAISFAVYLFHLRTASRKRTRSIIDVQLNSNSYFQNSNIGRRYEHTVIPALTAEPNESNDLRHQASNQKVIEDEPPGLPSNVFDYHSLEKEYYDMSGHAYSENIFPSSVFSKEIERVEFQDKQDFAKSQEIEHIEETYFFELHPDLDYHMYTSVKDIKDDEADAQIAIDHRNPIYENWAIVKENITAIATSNDNLQLTSDADIVVLPEYGNLCHRNRNPVLRSQTSTHSFPIPPPLPKKLRSKVQKE